MLKHTLACFAVAASLATLGTGCVIRARGAVTTEPAYVEVDEAPPPPRAVVVETRPGFVWIEGRWYRSGNRWVWMDGHWENERAGYVWEQGRWETRGRGHVWVEGRWRAGGTVNTGPVVRDHREGPPPPRRDEDPVVRDHRTH